MALCQGFEPYIFQCAPGQSRIAGPTSAAENFGDASQGLEP